MTRTAKRLGSFLTQPRNKHLGERLDDYRAGRISFAEFDACVQGWINHVGYAEPWGLRKAMLARLARRPASQR